MALRRIWLSLLPIMYALALETSGRTGSVALVRDRAVIDERTYPHGLKHATAIVPLLETLCREHVISPGDIREVYVSIGPGSFTGLRVGVTLAKTIAFATGARLVAVPSLRVLVENVPHEPHRHAVVALDAKRGQVFTGTFVSDGERWREVVMPRLAKLDDVLRSTPRPTSVIGDDAVLALVSDPDVTRIHDAVGRAAVVARLGCELAAAGAFTDPFALTPLYVRLPEAEEKRLIAEGRLPAVT